MNFWIEKDNLRTKALAAMLEDGKTWGEIATVLGCTRNAVAGRAHRLGLVNKSPHTPRHDRSKPKPMPKRRNPFVPVLKMIDAPILSDAARRSFSDMFGPLQFENLDYDACRWPIGDVGDKDFCFCGANRNGHLPYCAAHCRVAYNVPKLGNYIVNSLTP